MADAHQDDPRRESRQSSRLGIARTGCASPVSGNRKRLVAPKPKAPRGQAWHHARALGRQCLPGFLIAGSIGLAIGTVALGHHWLTHSPRFVIEDITVAGKSTLSERQVESLLMLQADTNIFAADMEQLEARLTASPWIASAQVTRSLPDALDVQIREHVAAAAIELEGLYLVNNQGKIFKRARLDRELSGLAIVTGIARSEFVTSTTKSEGRLRGALAALRQFQSIPDRPRIGELHLDKRRGLTLITYETAIAIHVGSPLDEELADRFQAFDSAWNALDSEEHAAARAFRIADRTPSDRVTVAFAGKHRSWDD